MTFERLIYINAVLTEKELHCEFVLKIYFDRQNSDFSEITKRHLFLFDQESCFGPSQLSTYIFLLQKLTAVTLAKTLLKVFY